MEISIQLSLYMHTLINEFKLVSHDFSYDRKICNSRLDFYRNSRINGNQVKVTTERLLFVSIQFAMTNLVLFLSMHFEVIVNQTKTGLNHYRMNELN